MSTLQACRVDQEQAGEINVLHTVQLGINNLSWASRPYSQILDSYTCLPLAPSPRGAEIHRKREHEYQRDREERP